MLWHTYRSEDKEDFSWCRVWYWYISQHDAHNSSSCLRTTKKDATKREAILQLRFSLECYTFLLVHSIIYMSWHTLSLYCSGSHQAGTKAKWFRAGCVILFVQWDKSWERIRKQLYMSCRGFSSAHRRAWTSSWMKFTCKLWTKARPSANKGEERKKCRKRVTEKKKRGNRKGENISNKVHF